MMFGKMFYLWTSLVPLVVYLSVVSCDIETFMIGAIFEKRNEDTEDPSQVINALNTAIEDINESENYEFKLSAIVKIINDNPFEAMDATCNLLENNVVGIFGPFQEDNSNVVQAISDVKEIPHIEVRWDDNPLNGTIVNVHPYPEILTKTYFYIIQEWGWKDFVILYEDEDGLKRVGELIKMFDPSKNTITVRQLREEYRTVLKELLKSGATHFVLDCTIDTLPQVLLHAQQVGLMTSHQNYIITNLDLQTLELVSYQYSETNITGICFFDPDDKNLLDVAPKIYGAAEDEDILSPSWKLRLEGVLMYDAVMMFAEAIKEALPVIKKKREAKGMEPITLEDDTLFYPLDVSCHNDHTFSSGTTLVNYMKMLNHQYEGLTGVIKFDRYGLRSEFSLNVIELKEGGVTSVGIWNASEASTSLHIIRQGDPLSDSELSIRNQSFIVFITMLEPYGMEKISSESLQGNDRYEGFAVDLIHELSLLKGFNYTLVVKESTGKLNETTNKWTGIIGAIIAGEGDLAVTDLTITYERDLYIDFTSPFMTLGISILYQKPQEAPPSFFSFADPFAFEVWRLLIISWIGVSFILFIVGRISPAEWENPYPCIEEPEYLFNQLDLRNCAWFITGSIMQQGSEIELKSISTRMVAGMWWFFVLLMVSSYTANLAAFLTTMTPDYHFKSFEELVNNAEKKNIKYGAKKEGSTEIFIKDKAKTDSIYAKAWDFIQAHEDEVEVKDTKLGVEKAVNEQYAFLMESSSIEYETQRKCTLQKVGQNLDEKSYGIALRKNESYRNSLSTGILQLQNSGKLEEIKRTWWEERRGGGQCKSEEEDQDATPLDLKNVEGVFYVTLGGTILAFLMAILETSLYSYKKSVKTKTPFWPNMKEEVKFYFKFNEMVKPVTHGSSSDRSASGDLASAEKDLPYDIVDKQPSVETLESYASNKSKKNKKNRKEFRRQNSTITC